MSSDGILSAWNEIRYGVEGELLCKFGKHQTLYALGEWPAKQDSRSMRLVYIAIKGQPGKFYEEKDGDSMMVEMKGGKENREEEES